MESLATSKPISTPQRAAVRRELSRILNTPGFSGAPSLSALLQYLVEETLNGRQAQLKEYAIATEVFNRPGDFDPRNDTIVRVQARRLRQRLADYYQNEGRAATLIFEIPKGSYKVQFNPPASGTTLMTVLGANGWRGGAIGLLVASLLVALSLQPDRDPGERAVEKRRFTPAGLAVAMAGYSGGDAPVISPDGKHIAFIADDGERALWVKNSDQFEPRKLAGTKGAHGAFWSPDSRFIGFAAAGVLKSIAADGGPTNTLCSFDDELYGGSWSPDGKWIAFSAGTDNTYGIVEVPARGGQAGPLFDRLETDKGPRNIEPHFLLSEASAPSLLFGVWGNTGAPDIAIHNFDTGQSVVLAEGWGPIYSPSGHILYNRVDEGLWALPFSLDSLQATGEPFPIASNSSIASVSDGGTLVWIDSWGASRSQLTWVNRKGKTVGQFGQPQERMTGPALSPDERHIVVRSPENGTNNIWVHQDRPPVKWRLTFGETDDYRPVWSHDGSEVTYQSDGGEGPAGLYHRRADGTGEPTLLVDTSGGRPRPWGWSRHGEYFVYTVSPADGSGAIHYLTPKDDGRGFDSHEFLATPFEIGPLSLSPDSRLLAYCAFESGDTEVYVREFPSGSGLKRVSTRGGCRPRWSRDGSELYYVTTDTNTLMAMQVTTDPVFSASVPEPLFTNREVHGLYDVSNDGRFVLVDPADVADKPSIQIVENWYEEYRDREQ